MPKHSEERWEDAFIRRLIVLLSTGLYSGFSPIAPGTAGTIVGAGLYLAISRLPGFYYGITVVIFLFVSCWLSGMAEGIFGKKDSERIVIDEIGGFLVTMVFLPPAPLNMLAGGLLFRFFDIAKPFPINRLQNLKGGFGVVADDVVAGIYSNLVLHICLFLLKGKPPMSLF